jgi:hypothetical protein
MTARRVQLLSVTVVAACVAVLAQDLVVRRVGEELRVAAPRLHFLTGKPLERMRNGASVTYDMQVIVYADNKQVILRRGFERFVISYDLWEETFSVARVRSARASAAHLSASAAEAWCLDNLAVPTTGLSTDRPVYVRLEVRALEQRDRRRIDDEEGLSLNRLIDIFSRVGAPAPGTSWRAEAGPVQLQNLKP